MGVALGLWKPGVAYLPDNWTGHSYYWLSFHRPGKLLAPKFAHILANDSSEHSRYLDTLRLLLSVLYLWYLVAVPPTYLTPGISRKRVDQDCKGRAVCVGVECMVRPLKMAVLLLSVHPLPDQCLLHLYPMHMTDLPTHLPQAPASDHSYQRGGEGFAPLLVSLVTNEPTWCQFPYSW